MKVHKFLGEKERPKLCKIPKCKNLQCRTLVFVSSLAKTLIIRKSEVHFISYSDLLGNISILKCHKYFRSKNVNKGSINKE